MQMCKKQGHLQAVSDVVPPQGTPRSVSVAPRLTPRQRILSRVSGRSPSAAKEGPTAVAMSPQPRLNGHTRMEYMHADADVSGQFDDPASEAGMAVPESAGRRGRTASRTPLSRSSLR